MLFAIIVNVIGFLGRLFVCITSFSLPNFTLALIHLYCVFYLIELYREEHPKRCKKPEDELWIG
ncbi:MAG: hypothetical protein HFJ28_01640 [Clostridia bacterium]|nr:hypothetical protein [Clostridia bacterium]